MVGNIAGALNAYQQALGRIGGQIPATGSGGGGLVAGKPAIAPSSDFRNMVSEGVSSVVEASKTAERMSIAAMTGKADIQDVVLAVANAEAALETVVAVRDSAIKAYKDIMSMPI